MKLFYFVGWLIVRMFAKMFYRLKVIGIENFPEGKILLAPNHISLADPPVLGSAVDRELSYMAKKELFENKLMNFILRKVNVFPVSRESIDPSAIKNAVRILKNNKPLVIFPQGTRNKDFSEERIKLGFIKIAKIAKSDILPVAIINTDKMMSFKQIKIIFSKPIPISLPEENILQIYVKSMKTMLNKYS
ncbi:MAG: lysophospholipid acyltransferase family protein [Endomicrobiia bacterium]